MVAYGAAVLSAAAMASVYIMDIVMADLTYKRASQAMFVSSIFAVAPGIVLAFLLEWDNPPPAEVCWMAFAAGVILMVANWLYFQVVYSDAGDCSEIACFEGGSVLMITLIIFGMGRAGVMYHDIILSHQWIGVVVGFCGLLMVHLYGDRLELVGWKHRFMLIGFMLFGAGYELLIDRAIHLASLSLSHMSNPEQAAYLQISPFFWFGLATGVVAILPGKERRAWSENLPNLKQYWWTVVLAEAFAVIAFGAAVLGFAEGHVAVIALLAGTFPVMVLIAGVVMRRRFGFDEETFPVIQHPIKKTLAIALVITGAVLASWN